MTWSGRPHVHATASGPFFCPLFPRHQREDSSQWMGVAHGPCCLASGGVSGGSGAGTTEAAAFSGVMGCGVDMGGCLLLLLFLLQMMLTPLRLFPQALDELSNTVSAPQFLRLSSRCNNVWL